MKITTLEYTRNILVTAAIAVPFLFTPFPANADLDEEKAIEQMNEMFLDPIAFCKKWDCGKGPSIIDPPILNEAWAPFESDEVWVWAADACLGFFMTKDTSAWNKGEHNGSVDEPFGITVELREGLTLKERIHIKDHPMYVKSNSKPHYGAFRCETDYRYGKPVQDTDRDEVMRWINTRLTKGNGWTGSLNTWEGFHLGSFRNDALGLDMKIEATDENFSFRYMADYFDPKVLFVFYPP